jgi:hypothetical protein
MMLDPVGPPVLPVRTAQDHGSLVVFSAYVSGAVPGVPDEIKQPSDFDLQTADGRLLQTVHNLSGTPQPTARRSNRSPVAAGNRPPANLASGKIALKKHAICFHLPRGSTVPFRPGASRPISD